MMDCTTAQDMLLAMDRPGDPAGLSAELRSHMASCAACAEMAARVRRIEALVAALPVPAAASGAARAALLSRAGDAGAYRVPRKRFITVRRLAVAAGLLLVVGVALSVFLLGNRPAQASSELVSQLVDWNVDLAQTQSLTERGELYRANAARFSAWLAQGVLSADELALAQALFDQGGWLAEHDDPLAAADRFCHVDELLTRQSQRAAARKDYSGSARRAGECQRLRHAGVEANLARLAGHAPTAQQKDLMERVRRRDRTTAADLARLAAHPDIGKHLKAYCQQHHVNVPEPPTQG